MIIYHPFKDAHHCMYRFISLLFEQDDGISKNMLCLADFYYLFPSQMKRINSWPRKNSKDFKLISSFPDQYETIINPKRIYFELREIQHNTIAHLLSKGIISRDSNSAQIIKLNKRSIPEELLDYLMNDEFRETEIFNIIATKLIQVPLNGKNGIKDKSGLMEFLYDQ